MLLRSKIKYFFNTVYIITNLAGWQSGYAAACKAVISLKQKYKKNNIELIFNLGGQKSQSSSSLAVSLYDQLQKKNSESNYVEKPWGFYKTFISEDEYLLKKIYINPGEELSEQSHNHRDEHWIIVSGKVTVLSDKKMQEKEKKNDHIFISRNTKHKIINHQDEPAVIIEVQTGVILSEDDIIRYNDKYKKELINSPGGGIGRHKGLKIPR